MDGKKLFYLMVQLDPFSVRVTDKKPKNIEVNVEDGTWRDDSYTGHFGLARGHLANAESQLKTREERVFGVYDCSDAEQSREMVQTMENYMSTHIRKILTQNL